MQLDLLRSKQYHPFFLLKAHAGRVRFQVDSVVGLEESPRCVYCPYRICDFNSVRSFAVRLRRRIHFIALFMQLLALIKALLPLLTPDPDTDCLSAKEGMDYSLLYLTEA